jgi:RNA-directed DNA polymerase
MFSFEARALAVKKITSNKGEKTPGVDNIIWNTPWEKYLATQQLRRIMLQSSLGYKAHKIKRV